MNYIDALYFVVASTVGVTPDLQMNGFSAPNLLEDILENRTQITNAPFKDFQCYTDER